MLQSYARWLVLAVVVTTLIGLWVASTLRPSQRASEPVAPVPLAPSGLAVPTPSRPVLGRGWAISDTAPAPATLTGPWRATPGQAFEFALAMRWQTHFAALDEAGQARATSSPSPEPQQRTMDLTGTLAVTVLDDTGADFLLQCRLDGMQLTGGAEDTAALLPAGLLEPILVRFHADGRIRDYHFSPTTPANVKHLWATLMALSHQFLVGEDSSAQTVAGLHDGTGEVTAQFVWDVPTLPSLFPAPRIRRRTVLHYTPREDDHVQMQVTGSLSEAAFADGWMAHVQVHEARESIFLNAWRLQVELTLQMQRTGHGTVALEPSARPPAGAVWEVPTMVQTVTEAPAAPAVSGDPSQQTPELIATLERLVGAGEDDQAEAAVTWSRLAEMVQAHPEMLPELDAHLRAGRLHPITAGNIITAVGKAGGSGTPEAVAMLAGWLTDATMGPDLQLATLIATHQLGRYAVPLIDTVAQFVQPAHALGAESPLPPAAALALGTFAAAPGLQDAQQERLRTAFEHVRGWAFESGQPELYVYMLANAARPEWVEPLLSYVADDNAAVRQAVMEALPLLGDDPRAVTALVETARSEDTLDIRLAAVDGLGQLPANDAATAALAHLATTATDETLRMHVVLALGRLAQRDTQRATAALEHVAAGDVNPEIRHRATEFLGARTQ
jgi:hypothetical protein